MLGKLDVGDPDGLAKELDSLRAELLADPYFKDDPSMQLHHRKTALAFHAKDNLPEVRREVFKLLLEKVDPDGEKVEVAENIAAGGEAPEQYPDWDDEW